LWGWVLNQINFYFFINKYVLYICIKLLFMSNPNGYVLYEGTSTYNGDPIVVIITGVQENSQNKKTGTMLQTYFLHRDLHPYEAVKTGADESICGNCIHRPSLAKQTGEAVCYVNTMHGPASVYKAYKAGNYPHIGLDGLAEIVKGKSVRLGSYGDPCIAPVEISETIVKNALRHTGYTHRWLDKDFNVEAWSPLVMASVDNVIQANKAVEMGMRYFRVSNGIDELLEKEVRCPASAEMGKRTTCQKCSLCSGTKIKAKNIVIADHGPGWKSRTKKLF